jgi:hypothetical protein
LTSALDHEGVEVLHRVGIRRRGEYETDQSSKAQDYAHLSLLFRHNAAAIILDCDKWVKAPHRPPRVVAPAYDKELREDSPATFPHPIRASGAFGVFLRKRKD